MKASPGRYLRGMRSVSYTHLAHEFLELGLPYEVTMQYAKGHNDYFFPYSSTILFRFPQRKGMPPVDITWYDGLDNLPPIPAGYGVSGLDPNIPVTNQGCLLYTSRCV